METKDQYSPIIWPKNLVADREMVYESIDLLYRHFNPETFGEHFGFIVSCSRHSLFKSNDVRGLLHKLDIKALPDFASAKINVTHEVQPGLLACAKIIPLNEQLKVACFDKGSIIPIKNFGIGKTFHSDVGSRLSHHTGQITSMAANSNGTKLATGCSAGDLALYQVCQDEIRFITRTRDAKSSFITDMSYTTQPPALNSKDFDEPQLEENLLLYSTNAGRICQLDTRCNLADQVDGRLLLKTEPRTSITSLLSVNSQSNQLIYFGDSRGQVYSTDLRNPSEYVCRTNQATSDGMIRNLKKVVVKNGSEDLSFLAFSNSTNRIQILDIDTMKPHDNWKLDRLPEGTIRDFVQVRNRIITCGDRCSVGCWKWDNPMEQDIQY